MHIITVPSTAPAEMAPAKTAPAKTAPAKIFPAYYLGRPVAMYQRRYRHRTTTIPQPS